MANLKYEQLRKKLEELVQSKYVPGEKFLTQRAIMERFSVSFSTVDHALHELVEAGMLMRYRGRGTFVCGEKKNDMRTASSVKQIALVLTPNVTRMPHAFYAEILFEISDRLSGKGYSFSYLYADSSAGYRELQERLSAGNRFCGALLIGMITEELAKIAEASGLPFVVVDSRIELPGVCYIVGQNEQGAANAVNYLIGNGHRRIGFVSTPLHTTLLERFLGYCNALIAAGIPVDQALIQKNYHFEDRELDTLAAAGPTAIFAANDTMAVSVCRTLQNRGFRIPEDISIVGFDGDYCGTQNHPRLTTVSVPRREMGRRAVECLQRKLEGDSPLPEIIPVVLEEQESVCRAKKEFI